VAGGSSLLEQLRNYIDKKKENTGKEKIEGRILEGTSRITT